MVFLSSFSHILSNAFREQKHLREFSLLIMKENGAEPTDHKLTILSLLSQTVPDTTRENLELEFLKNALRFSQK